jgi:hypothetical protein
MSESIVSTEIKGADKKALSFKRSDVPGAPITVTLNNETTQVIASELLLAVQTITED